MKTTLAATPLRYLNGPQWAAAFLLLSTTLSLSPATAATMQVDGAGLWGACRATEPSTVIDSCTLIIWGVPETPGKAEAYFRRGNAHADKGDQDLALADYEAAVHLAPNYVEALTARGWAYSVKKEFDLAVADYDEAIRQAPKYAPAYAYRASAHLEKQEYDKAIADGDAALRIDPKSTTALVSRGLALDRTGAHKRAIVDDTEAIRLNPKDAIARNNRGFAYSQLRQFDLAISDYNEAIRLSPKFALAFLNRSNAYYSLNNEDGALADLNTSIQLDPNDARSFVNRGDIYFRRGALKLALDDLNRSVSLNASLARAYAVRAVVYDGLGDHGHAMSDFENAVRLDPKDSYAWATRGVSEWQDGIGDAEQAKADLQRALELDPKYIYARTKLEEIKKSLSAVSTRNLPVIPGRRVALVIGNSDYSQIKKLPNAVKDAEAVVKELKARGFEVTPFYNLSSEALRKEIDTFREKTAPRSEVALVWYVGHGQALQTNDEGRSEMAAVNSDNFILGTDYAPGSDVGVAAITVGEFINAALPAQALHVVVVDACRGAVGKNEKDVGRGGYQGIDRPKPAGAGITPNDDNLYVVYSTAPNRTAQDGPMNGHSPFTQAFLDETAKGHIRNDVRQFFSGVKTATASATDRAQDPQLYEAQMSGDTLSLTTQVNRRTAR